MTVHRFFVDSDATTPDSIPVPPTIAHQVKRVLRLRDGDELMLLDGFGGQLRCRLGDRGDRLEVLERGVATGEPRHRLTICQALLKGDALERVIQQGTELGVAGFRLMISRRCVARELSERRLDRLRAIARESAEQSERGVVPVVEAPVPFSAALEPGAVLLYERSGTDRSRLAGIAPSVVLVGPEGGFDPAEVRAAEEAGVMVAGLGARILRAESVAIAAAAVILSESGDFA